MTAKTKVEKAAEVKATAIQFIKDKVAEMDSKISTAKLRAYLLIEGFSTNDKYSNHLIAEAGFSAARGSSGFRAELYARLIEGELDHADFNKMLANESKNVRKHAKHYWGIAHLANTIRAEVAAD